MERRNLANNLDFYRISYIMDFAKDAVYSYKFIDWWNKKAEAGSGEKIYDMSNFEPFCRNYTRYDQLVTANGEGFDIHDDYFICYRNEYNGELTFASSEDSIDEIEINFSPAFSNLSFQRFVMDCIKEKSTQELIHEFGIDCDELRDELAYQLGMDEEKLNISDDDIIKQNWNELGQTLKTNQL